MTFVVGGDPQLEFMRSTSNIVGVKVLAARVSQVSTAVASADPMPTSSVVARKHKQTHRNKSKIKRLAQRTLPSHPTARIRVWDLTVVERLVRFR